MRGYYMEKIGRQNNRIAIFLSDLQGGGAQRVMLDLASNFVAHGFDVDLILAKTEGDLVDQIPMDVNLVELNVSRMSSSLFGLIEHFKIAKTHIDDFDIGSPQFFCSVG